MDSVIIVGWVATQRGRPIGETLASRRNLAIKAAKRWLGITEPMDWPQVSREHEMGLARVRMEIMPEHTVMDRGEVAIARPRL